MGQRIALVLGVIERPARFGGIAGHPLIRAKYTLLTPSGYMLNQNSAAQRDLIINPICGLEWRG